MAQRPTFDYDIIIIGSGAAGSPAASILARAGKKVAIIERSTLGGESPNWGDIPMGALLHTATTYDNAKLAAKFGLRTAAVGYNYPSLMAWRSAVIKHTGASGNRSYYEKQGISVFNGNAHFLSPNEIAVNRRHLSARKFLIATGTDWTIPNITGADETPLLTPKTIFDLTRPPRTLFVVGSNASAMEIAYFFAIFGTKVYVSESAGRIMPEFDQEVGELIKKDASDRLGMTILINTNVVAVEKDSLKRRVTITSSGRERSVKVDAILVAAERLPATDLGLENAGVEFNDDGVVVNNYLQTSARHIFAAGSVVEAKLPTHSVLSHSRTAAHNLLRRTLIAVDDTPPLSVAFTSPEITHTGLSEDDCLKRDKKVRIAMSPLRLTARSNITNKETGFVKLIVDNKGVLIGATIVAPHASSMIAELTLAIRQQLTAEQLMMTPHCFTSWSEAIRIAAGKLI